MTTVKEQKTKYFNKNALLTCIFITFIFLLAGTEYLSWFYRLSEYFDGDETYFIGKIFGYICQIVGLAVSSLMFKFLAQKILDKVLFPLIVVVSQLVCVFAVFFVDNSFVVAVSGLLLNVFIGVGFGIYLTMLSLRTPVMVRGIVFGIGNGLASVGSWFISLIGSDNFIRNKRVLLIYIPLTAVVLTFILVFKMSVADQSITVIKTGPKETGRYKRFGFSAIFCMGLIICFFGIVNELSNSFPTNQVVNGEVYLELSRAFYAIGLILAGLLNDLNRRNGAFACMILLVTPFIMLALRDYLPGYFFVLIIFYVIGAFFSVFRALFFVDLYNRDSKYLFIACGGLMFGRMGECIGAGIEMCFGDNIVMMVLTAAILFSISFILFMWQMTKQMNTKASQILYDNLADDDIKDKTKTEESVKNIDFVKKYNLSSRETEVMSLILEGDSNIEISEKLFISVNTVKFHMKNILKKTECANRNELLALYSKSV